MYYITTIIKDKELIKNDNDIQINNPFIRIIEKDGCVINE